MTLLFPGVPQIAALGKPTVLVVFHGGSIALGALAELPIAIVTAGYPGFYGAGALADALFGKINRWGRLAVTW